MAQARVTTSPITVGAYDTELHVLAVRTVGYRATCSCGWGSQRRPTYAAARELGREHAAEHAAGQDTAAETAE